MVQNKWSKVFMLFIPFILSEIILLEDIETPERHGSVTINSTNNKSSHLHRRQHIPNIYPKQSSMPIEGIMHNTPHIHIREPHMNYAETEDSGEYRVKNKEKIDSTEPLYRASKPMDKRLQDLLSEIKRTKKEQEAYIRTSLKVEKRQTELSKLKKEKLSTAHSIQLIQNEIAMIENTLESLKAQMQGLTKKYENVTKQKMAIEEELISLEKQLQIKRDLLHRLHRLKKKYNWLRSEYSYYDDSSDYSAEYK
ncbi:hypothetical protein NEMIN01_2001 [Nematocida minor]|uniref:uncharacterized protein n=1 Tax=Nematocida minor TaxID=1912983 RepID=UPI002221225E|nr:uncharacterized protein NEMIN01_2001 [Nematocida minor]KAI5192414.1 hypothetical protein NEMIN01_2001 [Nematocida minor]